MPSIEFRQLGIRLADPAVLSDKEALRKRAEQGRAAAKEATSRPEVWLSVDAKGRLTSVEISTSWRQRLAPEQFADMLFAAYRAAADEAIDAGPAAPRLDLPVVPKVDSQAEYSTWLAQSGARLAALTERIAEVARANARARERISDARDVRSPAGYLTLHVRAGHLVGITGAAAGLRSANPNKLRQDVLDVFRSANLAAGR